MHRGDGKTRAGVDNAQQLAGFTAVSEKSVAEYIVGKEIDHAREAWVV